MYIWKLKNENVPVPDIKGSMGGLNCQYSSTNSGHRILVQDMARAVIEDREPMIPGEEARKSVEVILAIYESARTGKEVVLED